ncbi:hypothetical protein BMW23_0479 [Bodo saltans virus]|uniref:Uncharacterized protein n=1 Tax=Bodo saltans virus TaxID=2024608 RepID=A0A2H4UUK8_9VIRU|nr:hypothetical protein QJ851_gp0466 [Bodo saltans virus]ATZ80529.1 hypothetical protein BMW23_0479 [Bodo saltans virus]
MYIKNKRNKVNDEYIFNYHTWRSYDKYDEGLDNNFRIRITNKDIIIEYEKVSRHEFPHGTNILRIPLDWLYLNSLDDIPPMPEILEPLHFFENFTYDTMNLGKNIYLALCKIKNNQNILFGQNADSTIFSDYEDADAITQENKKNRDDALREEIIENMDLQRNLLMGF